MCNMSSFIEKRNTLKNARNIMKGLHLSIEQTLDLLKIDEYDRPWFIDYLTDDED